MLVSVLNAFSIGFRAHVDPGLELGAVGAAHARRRNSFQGWCPASEVNVGTCPAKPDHRSYLPPMKPVHTCGQMVILAQGVGIVQSILNYGTFLEK